MPEESRARFEALEAALLDDLSPEGALQTLLAHRLIAAAWRLFRADRLELELFCVHDAFERGLGRALVKDGRDAKVFPTLVRYRGAAQAELFRTLRALKGLQAEAAKANPAGEVELEKTWPARKGDILSAQVDDSSPNATRDEPERRASGHEGDTSETPNQPEIRSPAHASDMAVTGNESERCAGGHQRDERETRNEPQRRANGHEGDSRATRDEPEIREARSAVHLAAGDDLALRCGADVGGVGDGSRRNADGRSQGLPVHSPAH